ncbi:MAG: hypothetical protein CM1200mP2_44150 [Planctomycetaceae bacterium]|nr:MAG: hypothetical protein CM1200mP2_44150 [Planctomycetaceae bacterium]
MGCRKISGSGSTSPKSGTPKGEELEIVLRDSALRQSREDVTDQIEECLVQDVDESEWNWQALTRWANSRYNLGLNDKKLRVEPREAIFDLLPGTASSR